MLGLSASNNIDKKYMQEPDGRSLIAENKPELFVFDTPELNAETPAHLLDEEITPVRRLFVRNTGRLPAITAEQTADWTLAIEGSVKQPMRWSLQDLQSRFRTVTQTCVLECAGNGRAFFREPTGLPLWTHGAAGCAAWTGVRLRDLLSECEPEPNAVYTGHYAPDIGLEGEWPALSRGIPLAKALSPETMVVWALNGEPLPYLHGGPLRLIVPGYPGSAWQKWIDRIVIRDREHDGERMTGLYYRMPRRPVTPDGPVDETLFEVITDMPVRSVITCPRDGFTAPARSPLAIRGHAWSGHIALASVEVSADGGKSWRTARLAPEKERFAWRRFDIEIADPGTGPVEIIARAADTAGNRQPLGSAPWNPRGYCNNAAHRIRGTLG